MKKQLNTAIAALFLATASMTAMATEVGGTYVTAGMVKINTSGYDSLSSTTGITIDDTDTVATFTVGYQMDENLSLEGTISGETETSIALSSNFSGNFSGKTLVISAGSGFKTKTESYALGAKYSSAIDDDFSVYGKAGMLFWDITASAVGTAVYDGVTYSGSADIYSKDGSDLYYGVGGSYKIDQTTSINADYMTVEVDGYDTDALTVAVVFDI